MEKSRRESWGTSQFLREYLERRMKEEEEERNWKSLLRISGKTLKIVSTHNWVTRLCWDCIFLSLCKCVCICVGESFVEYSGWRFIVAFAGGSDKCSMKILPKALTKVLHLMADRDKVNWWTDDWSEHNPNVILTWIHSPDEFDNIRCIFCNGERCPRWQGDRFTWKGNNCKRIHSYIHSISNWNDHWRML